MTLAGDWIRTVARTPDEGYDAGVERRRDVVDVVRHPQTDVDPYEKHVQIRGVVMSEGVSSRRPTTGDWLLHGRQTKRRGRRTANRGCLECVLHVDEASWDVDLTPTCTLLVVPHFQVRRTSVHRETEIFQKLAVRRGSPSSPDKDVGPTVWRPLVSDGVMFDVPRLRCLRAHDNTENCGFHGLGGVRRQFDPWT